MSQPFEPTELPKALRFDPGWVYDPVPEWWIRELDDKLQGQIIAIRLDTAARILEAQMEGLGKAAELLRSHSKGS